MKIGIIGLPQSGKSTLFGALSGGGQSSQGRSAHISIVRVPDARLETLAELADSARIVHAEVEFHDSAGFSGQGKSSGAGLKVSEELRTMETLAVIVDGFSGAREPESDIRAVVDEMLINDLAQIESNVSKLEKSVQTGGARERARELEILKRCQAHLENERALIELGLDESELKEIRGYTFLSLKPLLLIVNIPEDRVGEVSQIESEFASFVVAGQREVAVLCATIESEIAQMDPDDRGEFLADLGIASPAVDVVIQKAYTLLGLIPFFTAGEKEARAWTIRRGTTAQKAAGVIHSDIERGFIRAEVIGYDDYVSCGDPAEAKKQGKLRLEGKEYVVVNGDVINYRFNV